MDEPLGERKTAADSSSSSASRTAPQRLARNRLLSGPKQVKSTGAAPTCPDYARGVLRGSEPPCLHDADQSSVSPAAPPGPTQAPPIRIRHRAGRAALGGNPRRKRTATLAVSQRALYGEGVEATQRSAVGFRPKRVDQHHAPLRLPPRRGGALVASGNRATKRPSEQGLAFLCPASLRLRGWRVAPFVNSDRGGRGGGRVRGLFFRLKW